VAAFGLGTPSGLLQRLANMLIDTAYPDIKAHVENG
jgi:hypothetical protein